MKRRPNLSRDLLLTIANVNRIPYHNDQYFRIYTSEGKVLDWSEGAVERELQALCRDGILQRRNNGEEHVVYCLSADGIQQQLKRALMQYRLSLLGQRFVNAAYDKERWIAMKKWCNWPFDQYGDKSVRGNDEWNYLPIREWTIHLEALS